MGSIRLCLTACTAIITSAVPSILSAETTGVVETQVLEWMNTERLISEEANDWASEKSIIVDMLDLMKAEKATLEEKISSASELSSSADEARAEITAEKEALEATAKSYETIVAQAEVDTRELLAVLPVPLLEEIQPLVSRLPKDSSNTSLSLSQRTQNIVGILSQLDKFNTGVTKVSETKEVSAGKTVQVVTLYFGLAGAYFADAQGLSAGYGTPGADGWEWTTDNSLAPDILELIKVYEQTAQAKFISLPFALR